MTEVFIAVGILVWEGGSVLGVYSDAGTAQDRCDEVRGYDDYEVIPVLIDEPTSISI